MNHDFFWDQRYREAGKEYLFGTEPNHYLQEHQTKFSHGQRVLCIADGEGRNSVWLARQGLEVTAVDISESAVSKARQLALSHQVKVNFLTGDLLAPDSILDQAEETYDWIVAIFIQFADASEQARLFPLMKKALRPTGHLLLQGYTPKQLEYGTGGPPHRENLYTRDSITHHFAGWHILELKEYEKSIHEGQGHKGHSALLGLVARKPGE